MGLFHFGKKKEADPEKAENTADYRSVVEKINIKEQSYTNDENRRFVMMIEEAFLAQGNDGVITVGMMRGTIKNGDAVYLLEPGDQICMVNVIGLAIQNGGKMEPVEEAANQVTGVKIYDITGRNKVAKYSVLTSVKPQINRKDPSAIENPYIWGLSFGYRKYMKAADFFDIFISELLITNVLVPMHRGEDGYAVFSISNPQSGGRDLLVFTDKYQLLLGDWAKTEDGENELRIAAMSLAECIDMICSQKGQTKGIALNAYAKFPIILPEEMLNTIYKSEEFQRIIREQKE